MSTVQFTDNSEKFKAEMAEKLSVALEAIGLAAEGYAKTNIGEPKEHADGTVRPNVETGRLRNSITHSTQQKQSPESHGGEEESSVYIGTNVEYAAYVEMGTVKMRAYPYLKPAVVDHVDEYKELAEKYLKE